MVVPYTPGGPVDIQSRVVLTPLEADLHQKIIVQQMEQFFFSEALCFRPRKSKSLTHDRPLHDQGQDQC